MSCFGFFSMQWLKNTPCILKLLFCINFMLKALCKVPKICNIHFWIEIWPWKPDFSGQKWQEKKVLNIPFFLLLPLSKDSNINNRVMIWNNEGWKLCLDLTFTSFLFISSLKQLFFRESSLCQFWMWSELPASDVNNKTFLFSLI